MCVSKELEKFIGQELFIDLIGKDFAPRGVLSKVENDFIVVGQNRILITAIASFRQARGGR